MRSFLELLVASETPAYPAALLAERMGEEAFDALLRIGAIVHVSPADYAGHAENPAYDLYQAGGQHPSPAEFVSVSRTALAQAVQRLLGLSFERDLGSQPDADLLMLGIGEWRGAVRDMYLLWRPAAISTFLALRAESRRDSAVFVPTSQRVPPGVISQYRSSNKVALVFLEDVLSINQGRLSLVAVGSSKGGIESEGKRGMGYQIVDQRGSRRLNESDAKDIISSAAEFDLWVDMTISLNAGRCRAGRSLPDGAHQEISLPRNHAAVIAELAERRLALHPRELMSIDVIDAERVIERARQAVDVRLSRYKWRSIHTLRGDTPDAKRFLFKPPEDLAFAILKPIALELDNVGEKETSR